MGLAYATIACLQVPFKRPVSVSKPEIINVNLFFSMLNKTLNNTDRVGDIVFSQDVQFFALFVYSIPMDTIMPIADVGFQTF